MILKLNKMIDSNPSIFAYIAGMYEDHRSFQMVQIFGRKPGQIVGITSAYDAAKFLLEEWPYESGAKLSMAKAILLKCLEGGCSAAVARVAFVEAAREANIFVEVQARPAPTGKPQRWQKTASRRR
ncbi:MAG: DUF982 domain-containing protein [Phyllobacterium sp.]|uniref:DUF982 domain-containing protein n=1 Tax=Phyllobacterium sp. TaxID=1871046 RepID=UPI0030F2EC98